MHFEREGNKVRATMGHFTAVADTEDEAYKAVQELMMGRKQSIRDLIESLEVAEDSRAAVWQSRLDLIQAGDYRAALGRTLYDVRYNVDENRSLAIVCQAIAEHYNGSR